MAPAVPAAHPVVRIVLRLHRQTKKENHTMGTAF